MMTHHPQRKFVQLNQRHIKRCETFAEQLAKHYASGGSPRSASRTGPGRDHVQRNVLLQTRSKIGEVAVALLFGLNPDFAVKWALHADAGYDLILPDGLKADIKTTQPGRKLIWSKWINDLYLTNDFDVIISVTVGDDLTRCWVEGWISKEMFFDCKRVSDGRDGLDPGTWNMDKNVLVPMDALLPVSAASRSFG